MTAFTRLRHAHQRARRTPLCWTPLRVVGKGDKERRVPVDHDVAGVIQTYLLTERPETDSPALFVVAKGPNRGKPLTPAGLRTVFRYHRTRAGVPAGNPHALRLSPPGLIRPHLRWFLAGRGSELVMRCARVRGRWSVGVWPPAVGDG